MYKERVMSECYYIYITFQPRPLGPTAAATAYAFQPITLHFRKTNGGPTRPAAIDLSVSVWWLFKTSALCVQPIFEAGVEPLGFFRGVLEAADDVLVAFNKGKLRVPAKSHERGQVSYNCLQWENFENPEKITNLMSFFSQHAMISSRMPRRCLLAKRGKQWCKVWN